MIDSAEVILNITGDKFSGVCFLESTFKFSSSELNKPEIKFPVWGVTIFRSHLSGDDTLKCKWPEMNGDIYVAGASELIFYESIGGNLSVSLYDNEGTINKKSHFICVKGELMKSRYVWGANDDSAMVYRLDGVIADPYGWAALTVYAKGEVYLRFKSSDIVSLSEYTCNPKNYSYRFDN